MIVNITTPRGNTVEIGDGKAAVFILGPCVIESRDVVLAIADRLAELSPGTRSEMHKRLHIVGDEIGRLGRLLTEFLELARPRELSRQAVELGELVEAVLDDIRSSGRRVVPACWYVREYLAEHPDYQDLVAH